MRIPRKYDPYRMSGWSDSRDHQTGRLTSSIGETADFCASIDQRYAGMVRHPRRRPAVTYTYEWRVVRQFTDREPQGPRGEHWSGTLAEGTADTLPHAKSAALAELRRLRAKHIAAGGDVGYGDAPTGDTIRAAMQEAAQ
jgi:hypothetical protein